MTTRTFAVNNKNDLYIGSDGNLVIVVDLQAVLQNCEHAAKAILGEMVLAVDQGVPIFQTAWKGVPNLQQYEAALRRAILNVVDVIEIVSLTISQDANTLRYTAVIRTAYGNGDING